MDNSIIAITGANGFLASSLIYYILVLSKSYDIDITIIALARNSNKLIKRFSADFISHHSEKLFIYPYLVTQPLDSLQYANYVIHAASNANPSSFMSQPFATCQANTSGTIHTLEYANKSNASNYILLSTSGVYGHVPPASYPLDEDTFGSLDPCRPENIYLSSKRISECLVASSFKHFYIPYNIIRPSITYGPGLDINDDRSFPYFLKCCLTGDDINLSSDGMSFRNYLYIRDFIDAFIQLIPIGFNQPFNVASSVDTLIKDLANHFCTLSPSRNTKLTFPDNHHKDDTRVEYRRTSTSQSRVTGTIGWEEVTSLQFGLERTIEHYTLLNEIH